MKRQLDRTLQAMAERDRNLFNENKALKRRNRYLTKQIGRALEMFDLAQPDEAKAILERAYDTASHPVQPGVLTG